jgi:hypothetical protein
VCFSTVTFSAPSTADNCGVNAYTVVSGGAPGSDFPLGNSTNTYAVTDLSGNQDSCQMVVSVTDVELPRISTLMKLHTHMQLAHLP